MKYCDIPTIVGVIHILLWVIYLVCLRVPGDHPDKEIRFLLALTERLSKK